MKYKREVICSRPPKHITIGISSACNNKCLFCAYHGEDAKNKSKVYNLPFMLSMEDFKKIADMAYKGGIPHIHICATGEPFLNPHILDMIDYVIHLYGNVSFQTNFWKSLFQKFNYLDEIVKRKENISHITTDLLSSDPKEHEYIKNGSSYEETMEQLSFLGRNASNIRITATVILTRSNYSNIPGIIPDLISKGVNNLHLEVTNLLSYDYSDFTSSDNVYTSDDHEITAMLEELVTMGKENGISVSVPQPADKTKDICPLFWNKIQTWPAKGCIKERYGENMIPSACAAVVLGELNSLGYLFDYDNIMDAWNNEKLVQIRKNLLKGIYPDEKCKKCCLYNKKDGYYKQKVKKKFPW